MPAKSKPTNPGATTKIMPCTCDHPYQDKKHGKGLRVHNPCKPATGTGVGHRCTVCGRKK